MMIWSLFPPSQQHDGMIQVHIITLCYDPCSYHHINVRSWMIWSFRDIFVSYESERNPDKLPYCSWWHSIVLTIFSHITRKQFIVGFQLRALFLATISHWYMVKNWNFSILQYPVHKNILGTIFGGVNTLGTPGESTTGSSLIAIKDESGPCFRIRNILITFVPYFMYSICSHLEVSILFINKGRKCSLFCE